MARLWSPCRLRNAPLERIALSPAQEQGTWQFKAVIACRGNQTLLGTILLQIIGRNAKNPPQITTTASVDEKGLVWAGIRTRSGREGLSVLGTIQDIRDEFRRLADHLKLDDGERIEMFEELRKWVAVDMRADHGELARTTRH
jgi:hypothetical protein